jgi:hypothetical protein
MKRTLCAVLGSGVVLAGCAASQQGDSKESATEQAVSTTQTAAIPFKLASPVFGIGGFQIGGTASDGTSSSLVSLSLTGQAKWTATANTSLSWDSDKVRQGQTLDMNRALGSVTGTMHVLWSISGNIAGIDFGPTPLSLDSVSCTPDFTPLPAGTSGTAAGAGVGPGLNSIQQAPSGACGQGATAALACNGIVGDDGSVAAAGGNAVATTGNNFTTTANQVSGQSGTGGDAGIDGTGFNQTKNQLGSLEGQLVSAQAAIEASRQTFTCTVDGGLTLFETPGIPLSPYAKLHINATFQLVQQKGTATSQFMVGQSQAATASLDITPAPADDSLAMPCSYPANTDVQYVIENFDWRPSSMLVTQQVSIEVGAMDPGYAFGFTEISFFNDAITPPLKEALAIELTAPTANTDLGGLQPNNVTPTVTAGPFNGTEGVPVSLSETTTSACPIASYAWTFSNGNSAFGANPSVLFGPHGQYSGQIVVTDVTHLSQTADFSASIANAPPVALAGPSTSGAWGTPIALVGQGSDPGSDPLTYAWNFGDGTQGVGGTTAQHAYASPGDYVATFTVCDDLNACTSAATPVHVRARRTSVAFTGTNTGVYSAQAPLSGSIVDELGQPVVGGTLAFTLAGADAGSAQTDSTGTATTIQTLGLPAGSYPTTATFGGTAFYLGGATSSAFAVTRMASGLQYTGAIIGNANKSVTLTAKLTDALNRPLAGKTVVFKLGTQQVQAVTDTTGIASTPLQLAQKNGSYPLSATWTPALTDATQWNGSSVARTFTIGNK